MKTSKLLLFCSIFVLAFSRQTFAEATNATNVIVDRLLKPYEKLTGEVLKDLEQQQDDLMLLATSDRHLKTVLWLKLLNRIDQLQDADFDANNTTNWPSAHVAPPPDFSNPKMMMYPPGTAPSSIEEPDIRAAFEKAIEENKKKSLRMKFERKLSRIDERSTELAVRHFNAVYAKSPEDAKELITSLDIVSDEKHRTELKEKLADYVKLLKPGG